jgi:ribonuclease-3 family protein
MSDNVSMNYSPLTLAFLGDAVYELLVRETLVRGANRPVNKLHRLSVERVRAAFQAEASDRLAEVFTEAEADIFRRGRNAGGVHVPKSSSQAQYRRATGLEAVFGYLYLNNDRERIRELFDMIMTVNETA